MKDLVTQDYTCAKGCGCFWKPLNSTFVMDCSNRNLTDIPTFVAPIKVNIWNQIYRVNNIEINLSNNNLEVGPSPQYGYENVTELNLSNNKIGNFNWTPQDIQKLHLDRNHLSFISDEILDKLNGSIKLLTLDGNPWTCNCSALKLQNFLIDNNKQIGEANIYCEDSGVKIIQNNELFDFNFDDY
ncbi:protein toll-like [Aethina tumida]|uniref:protein toll-like n=1 Tax=Aethina tumida TaxID=116153 RepID=UPI0021479824|nr:protein toll-like [Aethina tumida]